MNDMMITGYAGKVVTKGRCWSMTHIFVNGVALCGYKPNKSMSIQWCANGAYLNAVECEKCKIKFKNNMRK